MLFVTSALVAAAAALASPGQDLDPTPSGSSTQAPKDSVEDANSNRPSGLFASPAGGSDLVGYAAARLYWEDFDRDGLPDAFAAGADGVCRLLHNLGDGRLADVTIELGLPPDLPAGLGLWEDIDLDGSPDLLIAGEAGLSLWRNHEGVALEDVTDAFALPRGLSIRAAEWIDVDGDGLPDLHLVTPLVHRLFRNEGEAGFGELPLDLGVAGIDWAGGAIRLAPGAAAGGPAPRTGRAPSSPSGGSAALAGGGPTITSATRTGPGTLATAFGTCTDSIVDQATFPTCLQASSQPTLGLLYPLSTELNVDAAGTVNVGTTGASTYQLHVVAPQEHVLLSSSGPDNDVTLTGEPTGAGGLKLLSLGGGEFIALGNSGGEQLRLDAAGNLGLGTATPLARLDVAGDARISGTQGLTLHRPSDGQLGLRLGTGTEANEIEFRVGGVEASVISADSTGTIWNLTPGAPVPASELTVKNGDMRIVGGILHVETIMYADGSSDSTSTSNNAEVLDLQVVTGNLQDSVSGAGGLHDHGLDAVQFLGIDNDPATVELAGGNVLTQLEGPGGINDQLGTLNTNQAALQNTVGQHDLVVSHMSYTGGSIVADSPFQGPGFDLSGPGGQATIGLGPAGELQASIPAGFELTGPDGGVASLTVGGGASGDGTTPTSLQSSVTFESPDLILSNGGNFAALSLGAASGGGTSLDVAADELTLLNGSLHAGSLAVENQVISSTNYDMFRTDIPFRSQQALESLTVGLQNTAPAGILDSESGGSIVTGYQNSSTSTSTALLGGRGNSITGAFSPTEGYPSSGILAGTSNTVDSYRAVVVGGNSNDVFAPGVNGLIAGGENNLVNSRDASVIGGNGNQAAGDRAAVIGGNFNHADGNDSLAAGNTARALHDRTFVWSGDAVGTFDSTAGGQFLIDAPSGVGIGTNAPTHDLHIHSTTGGTGYQSALRLEGNEGFFHHGARLNFGDGNFVYLWEDLDDNLTIYSAGRKALLGGAVGIGTTTPSFTLHVEGSAGKPGGGSWSSSSDRRLKKNIEDIDGALERLLKLRGVTFEFKDPEGIGELPGVRTGMIAQEVQEVFPDWVDEGPDGYLRLTYRGFEALTVEALRDLREEKDRELAERDAAIERLRGELDEARARIEALERRIAAASPVPAAEGGPSDLAAQVAELRAAVAALAARQEGH